LNAVDPSLESAWFQPLSAHQSEKLVSKFALKFNLYRYTEANQQNRFMQQQHGNASVRSGTGFARFGKNTGGGSGGNSPGGNSPGGSTSLRRGSGGAVQVESS
jgi:hypothetical protein